MNICYQVLLIYQIRKKYPANSVIPHLQAARKYAERGVTFWELMVNKQTFIHSVL
jgi:hypothetical protein